MITSKRRIRKLFADFNRHSDDPMIDISGCGSEIRSNMERQFRRRLRDLTGLSYEQAEEIAEQYDAAQRAKRQRHRNPERLHWKRKDGERRHWEAAYADLSALQ